MNNQRSFVHEKLQEASRDLIWFLIDSTISFGFNIIAVVWLTIQLIVSEEAQTIILKEASSFFKIDVTVLIINAFLLFINIFTFNLINKTFNEFRKQEKAHGLSLFLDRSERGEPVENTYEGASGGIEIETKKTDEVERIYEHIPSRDSVEYETVEAEAIEIHQRVPIEETIYSDIETYDTIRKPDTDQYDQIHSL